MLPIVELSRQKLVQVGFEVHLYGKHPRHTGSGPGCPECHRLHDKLKGIVSFALPKDRRPTTYEIEPYHAAFYPAMSGGGFEVGMTLRIRHREGHFDAIDTCEIRCSHEIQEGLRALGSPRGGWVSRKPREKTP